MAGEDLTYFNNDFSLWLWGDTLLSTGSARPETNGLHRVESEAQLVQSVFSPLLSSCCLLGHPLYSSDWRSEKCPKYYILHYNDSLLLTPSTHSDKWRKAHGKFPCCAEVNLFPMLCGVAVGWDGGGGRGRGALHLDQYHRQLPNNWKKCVLTNTSEPGFYSSHYDCLVSLRNVFQNLQPSGKNFSILRI